MRDLVAIPTFCRVTSRWWLLLVLLETAGGPAHAQKVKVQHDPGVDFSRFKSYAWKQGTPAPHPAMDQLIRASVERELAAKGFRKQSEGEPDFYLLYHAGLDAAIAAETYEYGWADESYTQSRSDHAAPADAFLKGTLVVDIVDRSGSKLLWRGVASDTLEGVGERAAKKAEKAVDKLLSKFPPLKQ